jgi:high frequency lysogenization protein
LNFEKRVLPLAGLVQAVHLVIGAAKNGMVAQDSIDKTLAPIFVQNPGSIAEVYAGTKNVSLGLHLVQEMLMEFRSDTHGELIKYCLAVINLEKSLSSSHEKMSALGAEIRRIAVKSDEEDLVPQLAEVYEQIISRVEPRIRISGNRGHLQNIANVQRIRALLLSAIRSAVLWHQVGGRRWQLLFQRGSYKAALQNYI